MFHFDEQVEDFGVVIHPSGKICIVGEQVEIREQAHRRAGGDGAELNATVRKEFREDSLVERDKALQIGGHIAGSDTEVTLGRWCGR